MTSTKKILEFIGETRLTGMSHGRARALLHNADTDPSSAPDVRRFAEEFYELPRTTRSKVRHPADSVKARSYHRKSEELTPAELVWLQRLPLDPREITHDDAATLAGMAGAIGQMSSPSSYQLIQSIWAPVKEVHDRRVAEEKLKLAREPLPTVPPSALRALKATVRSEHRDWPDEAIDAQANKLMRETLDQRDTEQARQAEDAQRTIRELDATAADRVTLARDSA